jgi:hypothetical protein
LRVGGRGDVDHVLRRDFLALAPFTLEPEQAVASLDRIEGVDATWLLSGHGPAWNGGVPEAVRLIREAAAESRR